MQSCLPLPQSFTGVFQNLIESKYDAGAFGVVLRAGALLHLVHDGQAFVFAGVSPK